MRVGVVRQVPGGVEQALLGDVRRADVVEALLDVPAADVVLHLPLDHAALGVEDRQAGAELVGEGEQVQLGAELAVVARSASSSRCRCALSASLVSPSGAVDPLQLVVLLVAAPVRRRECA